MPNTELTPLARARQAYTFDRGRGTIPTATGGIFTPLDPQPEHVRIADIAHALGQKARFTGHCSSFYSVAEHAVFVSRIVNPEHAYLALHHDSAEYVLPDVASPIKPALAGFDAIETRVLNAIFKALKVGWNPIQLDFPHAIKIADNFACAVEKLMFFTDRTHPDTDAVRALWDLGILEDAGIQPPRWSDIVMHIPFGVDWVHARDRFMWRHMELSGATEADVTPPGRVPFDYGVSMAPETARRIPIADPLQIIDDPLRFARPGWCW